MGHPQEPPEPPGLPRYPPARMLARLLILVVPTHLKDTRMPPRITWSFVLEGIVCNLHSLFATMAPHSDTRAAQLTTSGLGTQFVSPRKPRDKRKTQTLVELPGQKSKQHQLQAKLASLLAGKPTGSSEQVLIEPELPLTPPPPDEQVPSGAGKNSDSCFFEDEVPSYAELQDSDIPLLNTTPSRRILPDRTATRLYDSWKVLIPTLVNAQLEYTRRTMGNILEQPAAVLSACRSQKCAQSRTSLIGLFFDSESLAMDYLCLIIKFTKRLHLPRRFELQMCYSQPPLPSLGWRYLPNYLRFIAPYLSARVML
jgi:hypothetical protein